MADPTVWHKLHLEDGFGEQWSRENGAQAVVTYECHWADRYDLIRQLIGGFAGTATGFGQWNPPHAYPNSPNLVATDVGEIRGVGVLKGPAGSKWVPWDKARFPVTYKVPRFAVDQFDDRGRLDPAEPSIPGCEIAVKGTSSFRTLPEGKLKFSGSGKTVDSDVGIPEPVEEISLTFKNIPLNPYPWVYPYLGCLNHLPMWGHMRGEVLFESIEVSASGNAFAVTDMTCKLNFLARVSVAMLSIGSAKASVSRTALDWNAIIDEAGTYNLVQFRSGGGRVFRYTDFWGIFSGTPDGVVTYYAS